MSEKHPFDKIDLESYVAGDITGEKLIRLEQHLKECHECREIVEELKEEQKQFLAAFPFENSGIEDGVTDEPESKQQKTTFFNFTLWGSVAALLAFSFLLLPQLSQQSGSEIGSPTKEHGIQLKGAEEFHIVVEGANGEDVHRIENVYHPGERIQICYSSSTKKNLLLYSIDGSQVTNFSPDYNDSSTVVEVGTNIPLPLSIRLDNYIGKEVYVMILSKEKLSVQKYNVLLEEYIGKGIDSITLPQSDDITILMKEIIKEEKQ